MSALPSPTVTPEDVIATEVWWRALMPRQMRDWFTDGAPNDQQGRRAVEEMQRRANVQVAALAQTAKADPARFEAEMGLLTKRAHVAAVALARGGARHVRLGDLADE